MIYPIVIQVIIEAVRGSGYTGDIAVDDISFTSDKCACKLPTVWLNVFEIYQLISGLQPYSI